jgi:NAD(P)-dependent dehydrogenase (short-subunit alcohol dehydrogenase family)
VQRLDLNGVAGIVTGGASGIGEASARQLAALGARVVVADLQEERGRAVASEIGGLYVKCDVSSEEDGAAAVAAAAEMGPLRVLVNSAGIGRAARTIDRNNDPMPQKDFEFVIRVNLLGTFNMLRQSAAAMAKTEPVDDDGQRGAIVNMASVAAFDGQIGQAAYSASKGGIVGMTLPIARELAQFGIRVLTIAPGLFLTPLLGALPQAAQDSLASAIPFPHRLGVPDEFAALALHMIDNPYLNGEVVRLDASLRMAPK